MYPLLVCLCLLTATALAQQVSFGVIGGTGLTRDVRSLQLTPQDRLEPGGRSFVIGPLIEVGLPGNFAVESNVLRRELRFRLVPNSTSVPEARASVTTWEFPLLVKYRLPGLAFRPFVEGGPSFRTHQNPSGTRPSGAGMTVGGGVEWSAGRFRLSPTLRYTRWGEDERAPFYRTNPHQLEFLLAASAVTTPRPSAGGVRRMWFGAIAGVPLTEDLAIPPSTLPYTGDNRRKLDVRFVGGLLGEFLLTERLSLEVNGLYRRLHFRDRPEVVVTWQIPALAKYRLTNGPLAPFVEAGPSFRLSGNRNNTAPSAIGTTAGAGLEWRARWLRLTPTLRYTRWAADGPGVGASPPRTKRDQVELLVGFSF